MAMRSKFEGRYLAMRLDEIAKGLSVDRKEEVDRGESPRTL